MYLANETSDGCQNCHREHKVAKISTKFPALE